MSHASRQATSVARRSRGDGGRDRRRAAADDEPPGASAREYIRAIGGGMLIGLPLLFTQEIWAHGFTLPPLKILALVAVGFVIVLGYSFISGFRRDQTAAEVLVDSVQSMGLGIIVATAALLLLGRIEPGISVRDAAGKIALEAIPIAFGASIARTQLAAPGEDTDEADDGPEAANEAGNGQDADNDNAHAARGAPFKRLFVAAGGALVFALNVAPTDEPVLLGIEADWWLLLLVIAANLLLTLALVFYADFRGGGLADPGDSPLDHPVTETVAAYAISLAIAVLLLWAFGRTDGASLRAIVGMTVMLAVVASLGAAVGRLLVGGTQGGGSSRGAEA